MGTTFTFAATGVATAGTEASLTFADLYTDVGEYRYGTRSLSAAQIVVSKRLVNRGYMEFLAEWDWAFMSPQATLAIVAADETTALPSAFGEMIGDFSFNPSDRSGRIRAASPNEIRDLKASTSNSTGDPIRYAIQPKAFTASTGQRWEVLWYPVVSTSRTLYYRYRVNANSMTSDTEYPLGGPGHHWTIRESCMRFAELDKGLVNGPHAEQYYKIALPRSFRRDERHRPASMGYMGDPSITRDAGPPLRNTVEHV